MSREKIWNLIARKLTGEASREELIELNQLIQGHPHIQDEHQVLQQLWESGSEMDNDYLEATYHLHYKKMEKMGILPGNPVSEKQEQEFHPSPFISRKKYLLLSSAAIVVILIVFTGVFINRKSGKEKVTAVAKKTEPAPGKIETKKASRTELVLPDGSKVWLNAGSKLNYEKIGATGNREVYLTGEGYFTVVRNPARPFIIHTSTIDVKVLGTEFNVKAYPDDATVETSLIHGSVQVFLKNKFSKAFLLKPNQKLVIYKSPHEEKTETVSSKRPMFSAPKAAFQKLNYINGTDVVSETAWVKNMLSFQDETFEDVAHKMERWYDVEFEFRNKNLRAERLTGSFQNESLKQAMDALQFSFRFNFKIENNKVLIY
ncbi:MAG: FecR family protein [Chitinophagaceae bacterium]|nr:FecR family protein [Chitinophagaceae bacterium]